MQKAISAINEVYRISKNRDEDLRALQDHIAYLRAFGK